MNKLDPAVRKETGYIALVTLLLGVLQQAVFLIIGKWSFSVLLGGIYGWAAALMNFFLMALTVQKAVSQEEKDAKNTMKLSQNLRSLSLLVLAAIAYLLPFLNTVSAILPYLYPRIAIA
ncbi:MAG: ATP synthase subunit I, partial [Clostridia bacterium]|nr:ATP synthase subunit I [Clostridia bacterium]